MILAMVGLQIINYMMSIKDEIENINVLIKLLIAEKFKIN
jgi:hypothetical protein